MSAPAANAFSDPVIIMQATSGSVSNPSMAPLSSLITAELSALSACGRLSRMMPILPRVSTMRFWYVMDGCLVRWLFLAHRTEEGRPPGLHHATDGAAAALCRARPSLAIIDAEIMLEVAKLAVGAAVIAQRGPAGLEGIVQHVLDGRDQRVRAGRRLAAARRQRGRTPSGRQVRAVQRLAHIDVAQARHHLLVRQRRLEARLLAGAALRQHGGV